MTTQTCDSLAVKGLVSNLQRFSLHDGPGIRTTVFLKGCPLACAWCSNPETQAGVPELLFPEKGCIHCGSCAAACPEGALHVTRHRVIWIRERCTLCRRCLSVCPSRLPSLCGEEMTAAQVLAAVERDRPFYEASAEGASLPGGITLSGGEPLLQPQFALALLRESKRRAISTCIETTLCCPYPVIAEAAGLLDWIYCDLKHIDGEKHRRYTGADNRQILENMERLLRIRPDLRIRVPVIPGFNDSPADIDAICSQLRQWGIGEVQLMRYHSLGLPKYRSLGRTCSFESVPPLRDEAFESICNRYRGNGILLADL